MLAQSAEFEKTLSGLAFAVLCIYTYMKHYLNRTLQIRGKEKSFFLTVNKPFRQPTTSTVCRWAKQEMEKAGIDTKVFKTGSVRGAVASKAKNLGVPLQHILSTGGWVRESTFTRFYNKEVRSENTFQNRILSG